MSADEEGDYMKRAAAILMMMVMISLWQQALCLDRSDFAMPPGLDLPSNLLPGSGIKKMEDRMAEALAALPISPGRGAGGDPGKLPSGIESAGNYSENCTINSSLPQNGSLNNISLGSAEDNSSLSGQKINADIGTKDSGSSPSNSFKGSYATRASRHEIGKGGVDSTLFLEGEFEMDKSIKFQDQGF